MSTRSQIMSLTGGVVLLALVATYAAAMNQAPPAPVLRPFADDHDSMLVNPMVYRIGTTQIEITVPDGFVTDFTSTPALARWLVPTHGRYTRAAIIHDYLYWTQICKRKQADTLMLLAMKESGVDSGDLFDVYYGLRLGGEGGWKSNQAERAAHLIRVIPSDRRDVDANKDWAVYRGELKVAGVKEPLSNDHGSYCSLGDSKNVPTDVAAVIASVDARSDPAN